MDDSIYEKLAKEILEHLKEAENWWRKMPQENETSQIKKLLKNLTCVGKKLVEIATFTLKELIIYYDYTHFLSC